MITVTTKTPLGSPGTTIQHADAVRISYDEGALLLQDEARKIVGIHAAGTWAQAVVDDEQKDEDA